MFVFFLLLSSVAGFGQESVVEKPSYEVQKVYPYISVTKEELQNANTLSDLKNNNNRLHLEYCSSWVKEYLSIEILTIQDGKLKKLSSNSDEIKHTAVLTKDQKNLMLSADTGKEISVVIKYLPQNNLVQNEPREIAFSLIVDPENDASFPGGKQKLENYLQSNAIDKIQQGAFEGLDLSAIKFTINKEGGIVNASVFGSEYDTSPNEELDKLLLETIAKMPCWQPARYSDGTPAEQEFVWTVGNQENCLINLLQVPKAEDF